MGCWAWYAGDQSRTEILKSKEKVASEILCFDLDEEAVLNVVGIDPFSVNTVWDEGEIGRQRLVLEKQLEVWIREIQNQIQSESRSLSAMPWMQAWVDTRVLADKRIQNAKKLLAFIARAQEEEGTLVFWGD